MKKVHTSIRLNQIMNERNLKQVDILRLTKPLYEEYGEKISKSDLSQYVSGRTEPGQKKLFILGKALNVNPSWLMGLDVSREIEEVEPITTLPRQTGEHLSLSPTQQKILSNCQQLNETGQKKVLDFSDDLIDSGKYAHIGREPGYKLVALGGIATEGDDQPPIEERTTLK